LLKFEAPFSRSSPFTYPIFFYIPGIPDLAKPTTASPPKPLKPPSVLERRATSPIPRRAAIVPEKDGKKKGLLRGKSAQTGMDNSNAQVNQEQQRKNMLLAKSLGKELLEKKT